MSVVSELAIGTPRARNGARVHTEGDSSAEPGDSSGAPLEWPWWRSLERAARTNPRARRSFEAWGKARTAHRRILAALAGARTVAVRDQLTRFRCLEGHRFGLELDGLVELDPQLGDGRSSRNALESGSLRRRVVCCPECGSDALELAADGIARSSVQAVQLGELGTVVTEGRDIRSDWLAEPERLRSQLASCSRRWRIVNSGGRLCPAPLRCDAVLCPLCARIRAMRSGRKWTPILAELDADGFQLAHLTMTLPRDELADGERRPTLLTARERAIMPTTPAATDIDGELFGYAVPGERLGDGYRRLRSSWTALRNDRSSRSWWQSSTAGALDAVEWTATGGEPREPRWHVHLHVLVVLRPDVRIGWRRRKDGSHRARKDRGWMRRLVAEWSKRTGANPRGIQLTRVGGSSGRSVESAVREVLKYPFKPSSLTRAQLVSCLAQTKGLRTHLPSGGLHASHRIGRRARELEALAELAAELYGCTPLEALAELELDQAVEERASRAIARARLADPELEESSPVWRGSQPGEDHTAPGWDRHLGQWVRPLWYGELRSLEHLAELELWHGPARELEWLGRWTVWRVLAEVERHRHEEPPPDPPPD